MNRPLLSLFVASIFYLAPTLVAAQGITGLTRVNPDEPGSTERSPILQLGRDNSINIAYIKGNTTGDIYFTRSSDYGKTFATPTRVTMTGKIDAGYQRTAQFVLDTEDNIHMVWMEERVNKQADIWYSRSIDKGATWTTPVSVVDADDSSKYMQDFCSIAVDSNDNLYVSFLDFRDEQRKKTMNGALYLTRSNDGGKTWSVNTKANVMPGGIGGTCECCKQDIAVSPEGHVYIAFRSNINNRRDVWVARSMDKGDTFEEAILIQSSIWTIPACPASGPNIALDSNESLHVVWVDDRDDSTQTNTYYARLPKDSRLATTNQKLNNQGEFPKWPDVAVTRDGRSVQAVYQVQLKPVKFVYQVRDENTPTGGFEIHPNGKTQEFCRIKIGSNSDIAYFVWQDRDRDNGDIFFATHAAVASVPKAEITDCEVKVFPNPSSGNVSLSWEDMKLTISDLLQVKIYSTAGELVKLLNSTPNKEIDLDDIPTGSYQLMIYNGNKLISTQKLSVVR